MKLWNACCTGDSDFIQNLSPDLPFIDGLLNMKNHPVFVSRLLTGAIIARIVILYISPYMLHAGAVHSSSHCCTIWTQAGSMYEIYIISLS